MKILKYLLLFIILVIPFSINADAIKDIEPTVNIRGIDYDKYDVTKEVNKDKISIIVKEKDGDISYSWNFDRSKIKDNRIDMDFGLTFKTKLESFIDSLSKENDDKLFLNFSHHGDVPDSLYMNIYVGNKYNDGDLLYLYYFNEKTEKIEFVDKDIEVKNGYVSFEIEHCSIYFLTKAIVTNAIGNPITLNRVIILLVLFISGLSGVIVFAKN